MPKVIVVVVLVCLFFCDALQTERDPFGVLIYTRFRRYTENNECTVPADPDHGTWKLLGGEAKPGGKIDQNSVIKFECHVGYKLSTQNPYLICDDNWRSWTIPECEELCPPVYSSDTFEVRCRNKIGKEVACSEATHGTSLEYECARFYETPFGYKKTLFCENGSWNNLKPVCQPACGRKITDGAKPLIVGSKPNKKLEYPWVAAVYQKVNDSFVNICGASILSPTVVLTAAHCVTNVYGDVLQRENYTVGAGKLYSEYQASQDEHAQYLEVSKIIVHDQYKGDSKRFLADIAILVMNGEFTLNEVVQPVCFNNMNNIQLHAGSVGEVSGWGRTEDGLPSAVLRTLTIPYKYETTCARELPPSWADKYNMIDKLCAGFYNQSSSVCDGDSGSGLAFKNPDDNRYYIHGVVSVGPAKGGLCNIQQNTLYTKVAFYYEYVDRLLTRHAPQIKDCVLPPHPQNGKWTISNQEKKPGDVVVSSTILNIECNKGFKLLSSSTEIECGSSRNMSKCEKLCPQVRFREKIWHQCIDEQRHIINCSTPVHGTQVLFNCGDGVNTTTCVHGLWDPFIPRCVIENPIRNCGRSLRNSSGSLTADGNSLEFPWNVMIYNKKKEYKYICGGTLLSKYTLLTAAHCVTDDEGKPQPNENFLIGAGKVFIGYNDSRDEQAQYSEAYFIIPDKRYKGYSSRYFADIAIVVIDKPFTLNRFIRPVCSVNVDNILLDPGAVGAAWGWRKKGGILLDTLETFEIPIKEEETCKEELTNKWTDKLEAFDKLCAGPHDQPLSLCRVAPGTGLIIKNPEDDRYYIHGVASISPVDGLCQQNILFTSVPFYHYFMTFTWGENEVIRKLESGELKFD